MLVHFVLDGVLDTLAHEVLVGLVQFGFLSWWFLGLLRLFERQSGLLLLKLLFFAIGSVDDFANGIIKGAELFEIIVLKFVILLSIIVLDR